MPPTLRRWSPTRRWIWIAAVMLSLIGGSLRVVAVRAAVRTGEHLTGDSYSYFLVAHSIRELVSPSPKPPQKWFFNGLFVRGAVYPAVLLATGSATSTCGGDILTSRTPYRCPVTGILTLNVVFGVLTCLLTFVIGDRIRNPLVGLLSCALVAFSPDLINTTGWVMTEPFRTPIVLGLVLTLEYLLRQPTPARALGAGSMVGLLAISHTGSTFIVLPLLLWVLAFVRPLKLRTVAIFLAPSAALALGWVAASRAQFGEVVMPGLGGKGFAGGGAWTAMVATRPERGGTYDLNDEDYVNSSARERLLQRLKSDGSDPKLPPLEPEIAEWIRKHGVKEPIPDAVFWQVYKNRFRQYPVAFIKLTLNKAWRLLSEQQSRAILDNKGPIPGSVTFHLGLLGLAVLGAVWPRKALSLAERTLLLAMPAFMLAIFSLALPQARYWTPALPILSILAAVALEGISLAVRAAAGGRLGQEA